jgi:hypothetical protein
MEGWWGAVADSEDVPIPIPSPRQEPMTRAMWPSLDWTRRRILGERAPAPHDRDDPEQAAADSVHEAAPGASEDLVLAIGRPEVLRLAGALQALLGPETERPDTPARLEAALTLAVERLGGGGAPRVTRRPPGLYTPEAWQVHLIAVRPAVSEAIRGAIRTGGFA